MNLSAHQQTAVNRLRSIYQAISVRADSEALLVDCYTEKPRTLVTYRISHFGIVDVPARSLVQKEGK